MIGYLLIVVSIAGCHGPRGVTPEGLLLNDQPAQSALVETTISGMVYCAVCTSDAGMMIEVALVGESATTKLADRVYDAVGAYEITVRVAEKSQLKIRAQLYVTGGVITTERAIEVPAGESAAALTVDLMAS